MRATRMGLRRSPAALAIVRKEHGKGATLRTEASWSYLTPTWERRDARDTPLSDEEQKQRLQQLNIQHPAWLAPTQPHEQEAVAFCVGLLTDFLGQLGEDSTVASQQAHVSRDAFTTLPFERDPSYPTCGGRNRVKGYKLNIGNYDGFEALTIRVTADVRLRELLKRTLRFAGAASFVLNSPHKRPKHYAHWMWGKGDRMFFVKHAVLVVVTALVACCCGYGAPGAKRSRGEVLDVAFSVVGGKSTSRVQLSVQQQADVEAGGQSQFATAHRLGNLIARAHVDRCIGAVTLFTSYFLNVLPSLAYVGVGSHYTVVDDGGRYIYMMPRIIDLGNALAPDAIDCFACLRNAIDTQQPQLDAPMPSAQYPRGPATGRGPESLPVALDSEGRTPDVLFAQSESDTALGSNLPSGTRARVRPNNKCTIDTYTPLDFPFDAGTTTVTFPHEDGVHRVMSYLPDLQAHEDGVRASRRASNAAGNLAGSVCRSLGGSVLLLDGLQRGAVRLVSDVSDCIANLDEGGWEQRTETTFMRTFQAGQHNPALIDAYNIPGLIHTHLYLMHAVYFRKGHAFTHALLADTAVLGAAAGAALSVAHIQALRTGPVSTADRAACVAGLAECTNFLRHMYDGDLDRRAIREAHNRGHFTAAHLAGLALRRILPPHMLSGNPGNRAPQLLAARTTTLSQLPRVKSSTRSRAAALMAGIQGPLRNLFNELQVRRPEYEFRTFMADVSVLLERLLAAVPADKVACGSGRWIIRVRERLLDDTATRSTMRLLGHTFFDVLARAASNQSVDRDPPALHEEAISTASAASRATLAPRVHLQDTLVAADNVLPVTVPVGSSPTDIVNRIGLDSSATVLVNRDVADSSATGVPDMRASSDVIQEPLPEKATRCTDSTGTAGQKRRRST